MIEVKQIQGRAALRKFVQFQIDLYRGVDAFVPPMIESEVDCLDPDKNPAFEFCQAAFFVAVRDGKWVGRIAGIINQRSNEQVNRRQCRFCYCDFIDDLEVSRALLDRAAQWGREQGMEVLVGPLGLTDLDAEGCLVEGFDQLATSVEIYNYDYYPRHFEAYGMKPEAYWNGYHMTMPDVPADQDVVPEKHRRIAEIARQRYGLKVLKFTSAKVLVNNYGRRLFQLYNAAYAPIYGFTPITDKQIDYYIQLYLPQVRLDLIRLIVDAEDNVIAFGIAIPSLSRAQQRAKGKMFPFGWYHMARAMYLTQGSRLGNLLGGTTDTCDLLLVGIRPDMQGKGINALLFADLMPQFRANGYKYVETNNELETNHKVQNMWNGFDHVLNKRRCTFLCNI